jgi:TolA-binding protein
MATTAVAVGAFCPESDALAQSVSDKVLSDVSAQTVGDCTTTAIKFNGRIQILSHFPEVAGRELRIRIRLLDNNNRLGRRESLRTPSGLSSLRSIEYEGDSSSGPILSLFFSRDMKFDVAAGASPDTLLIAISEVTSPEVCAVGQLEVDPTALNDGPRATSATSTATPAATQGRKEIAVPAGLYVVNLLSKPTEIGDLPAAQASKVSDLLLYETRFERDGQTWHRMRAGFFESRAAAEAARTRLLAVFPEAWVVKVTAQEREQGVATSQSTGQSSVASATPTSTAPATDGDAAATGKAVTDAESAIKAADNDRAIQLLTKAIAYPENDNTPRARELLGLTRERKNQSAQARAEYEEYLRRYPTGDGAERVRQRLASLDTSNASSPSTSLRNPNANSLKSARAWRWNLRGSFSQFYFRDQTNNKFVTTNPLNPNDPNNDPVIDNAVNLNQLLSNADVTVTGGNDRTQMLFRAAGSYTKSFRPQTKLVDPVTGAVSFRSGDVKTLSAAYLDVIDNVSNLSARIGRQTRNGSGVLGRFDGGLIGWQAKPRVKFNVVGGTPVLRARDLFIRSDRFFYGASVDLGGRKDTVQSTLYWYDERSHGLIDRQALGAEVRYLKGQFNAYGIFDYDVHFGRVNLGLLTLNYTLKDQSSFSITADYRQSPLLNTWNVLNGLSGQILPGGTIPIADLQDLRGPFTDPQIYRLAADNTIVAKSLTVSYSRPLTKKLQTNLDFTMTHTGGSPGSTALFPVVDPTLALIAPTASTGTEYYYGAQLVGSGLIFSNDIYILGGRYADTPRARTYTVDLNARLAVTNKFRLSPRARYGYRKDKLVVGTFTQFQPSLRMNFYPIKQSEIEIEVGGNFSKQKSISAGSPTVNTERGILLSVGYRLDF